MSNLAIDYQDGQKKYFHKGKEIIIEEEYGDKNINELFNNSMAKYLNHTTNHKFIKKEGR